MVEAVTPNRPQTETIGRFPHLLAHVIAQLASLAAGHDTFDDIRGCYDRTMKALAARGLARVTASRGGIGANLRHWTSARDLIKEFQTLGWILPDIPTPSTRTSVDAHRTRRYPLSEAGRQAAAIADDRRALVDLLTDAALEHHPYLGALLRALADGPIFCPELTEGDISRKLGSAHYATNAAEALRRSDPLAHADAGAVEEHLRAVLLRRFGKRSHEGREITSKERQEAANAAFADYALQQRGLHFGTLTFNNLVSWASELRLLDDSRYVPGRDGGRLIWLCCELTDTDGRLHAERRPYTPRAHTVARAVIDIYFEQRDRAQADRRDSDSGDFQLIHVVRAGAAFATGTAREVAERAIADLAAGGHPELGVKVRPIAARFDVPPRSEPMYARGGVRAMKLSIRAGQAL